MNDDLIGRDEAERILRDAAGGPRPGQDDLTAFLAAAAAPAHDHELAGEEAAVAAFRQSRLPAPQPRRHPLIARALTVKTAVAVGLSATAIGGVALAASTGTLPGPIGDQRPASHRTSGHPATRQGATLPAAPPSGGTGGSPSSLPSSAGPVPSPSPASQSPAPGSPGRGNANGNGNGKAKGNDKTDKKPKKSHSPQPTKAASEKSAQ